MDKLNLLAETYIETTDTTYHLSNIPTERIVVQSFNRVKNQHHGTPFSEQTNPREVLKFFKGMTPLKGAVDDKIQPILLKNLPRKM